MEQCDLSILIPARNEMFLARTIQDILEHIEADTEVIATLDGAWTLPGYEVEQHKRVNIIYVPEAVGQRAATNLAARLARGRFLMKLDAHCSFDQGFDRKMLEGFDRIGHDVTMVPVMRNLWGFSWKCYHCGWKTYQGPTPEKCGDPKCGKSDRLKRKMMWIGKHNPQNWSYCFDAEPHFQYFSSYKKRPNVTWEIDGYSFSETMSLQGSCFMASKEMYWERELCDDSLGSWGNQGIEVACATWLTGGRVVANLNTWYGHMFRTQGGDFGMPYDNRDWPKTKARTWRKFTDGKWPKQIRPVSWLVEKFWPVPGWDAESLKKLKENEGK